MIGSTLTEQKVAALFLFSSIEIGLFQVERALPTPGHILMVARCQRVVGKCLSIWNNRVSMDENRKSVFFPDELII